MRVQVQKWGNSLALRIPKPFADEVAVREGGVLDLSVARGRLVATPVAKNRPTLRQMLRRVTRSNLHRDTDFGRAAGREVW
jgi:antitoxin MazE